MLPNNEFRSRFVNTLYDAGEALEEEGLTVVEYEALLKTDLGEQFYQNSESVEEAFDQVVDEVHEADEIEITLGGEAVSNVLSGDVELIVDLITSNFRGGIRVEQQPVDVPWEIDPAPDYGRIIRYRPKQDDFKVRSIEDFPHHGTELDYQQGNEIIEAFEKHGFEADWVEWMR